MYLFAVFSAYSSRISSEILFIFTLIGGGAVVSVATTINYEPRRVDRLGNELVLFFLLLEGGTGGRLDVIFFVSLNKKTHSKLINFLNSIRMGCVACG